MFAQESFTILKSLGKGKYAEVKEVKDKFSKKHFAWTLGLGKSYRS